MSELIPNVTVPEGKRGNWSVEQFEISKSDAVFAMFSYKGRAPSPGKYTRLMRGRGVVMSDVPAEKRDHFSPVLQAKGHCLLNGLGLGMVLNACLLRPGVERITVVEIDPDVVALVAPHYRDPRVEIVIANAFDYKPPKGIRYGMVWHDIWSDMCADNLPEMAKLHRKYGRRCDWQGSWGKSYILSHRY